MVFHDDVVVSGEPSFHAGREVGEHGSKRLSEGKLATWALGSEFQGQSLTSRPFLLSSCATLGVSLLLHNEPPQDLVVYSKIIACSRILCVGQGTVGTAYL